MKKSWKERLIIHPESKKKSLFDITVLLLVGYSCVINTVLVAYIETPDPGLKLFNDSFVETMFYLDFILSFFTGYRENDDSEIITDYKKIAMRYLVGWFPIDLISIFPFQHISFGSGSESSVQATKLVRLARLPRLFKLMDISRI